MTDPYQSPPAAPDEVSPLAAAPSPSEGAALARSVAAEAALPDDLRTPWDLVDMLIFFVFGFGMLFLVTNMMATLAIRFAGVKPENLEEFARTNAGFVVLHQIVWFGLLLGYLSAVIRVRTEEPVWRALGWRGLPGRATTVDGQIVPASKPALRTLGQVALLLAGGALLALLVQVATLFVGTSAKLPIQALFADRRSILYMMGFGVAVAPLAEETVFRGFLYPLLARRFGVVAGVVFTGMFFGLMHAEQLWGGWGEIGLLIIVGMVFTAARARSGSVAVSYLLHLGYNGLLFLGTYIATGGLRHFPTGK
jgi:membrane protease YdiL (CAAX protease family)